MSMDFFRKVKAKYVVASIRKNWAISDAKRDAGLTIPEDIEAIYDISYGDAGSENLLDIYMPKTAEGLMPAIVNVHGGAWVYGNKEIYKYYCMGLALRGFVVVNFNYRLAPESPFPAQLEDINRVLSFVAKKGADYHIDKDRLVLIGDSAGAQLTSQYGAIYSNKAYAELFEFQVPEVTIKVLGLNCGGYDCREMLLGERSKKNINDMLFTLLNKNRSEITDEVIEKMDVLKHITADYPPAYVMSAYDDYMCPNAEPMYKHLIAKGIEAKMKIYGSPDRKDLGHVFHVNCRLEDAKVCNDDECEFFKQYV